MVKDLLRFLEIGDRDRQNAHVIWQVIAPVTPHLIDEFYRELLATRIDFGLTPDMLDRLQAKQFAYWNNLFESRFDDDYVRQAYLIGQRHREIGIPMAWYLAGYWRLKAKFNRALLVSDAPSLKALQQTLEKYAAIDVSLSLAAYAGEAPGAPGPSA